MLESFNPPENTEPLVQRLDVIGKHAAPALYNAAEMKRIPLKFLWWPLAKVQEGVGGKAKFIGIAVVILLAILIGAMAAVPYQLRMEAKGQLLPVEIAQIYPRREGIVRDIRVRPGDQIAEGYEVVTLESKDLQQELRQAQDKLSVANATIVSATQEMRTMRDDDKNSSNRLDLKTKLVTSQEDALAAQKEKDAILKQYFAKENQPGFFEARSPQFDPKLKRPKNSSVWTVLNDDRRENLLGRTMRPHEELLRVGNLQGPWQVELKIPQRNMGQILKAFTDPKLYLVENRTGRKYLDVDVLLSSQPETSYLGRLYKDDISAQAVPSKTDHDETEPVVTAYVKLNLDGPDGIPQDRWVPAEQFVTGLEVRTRIRCGDHPLGYSMFHGVYEWFYEKVIFFF